MSHKPIIIDSIALRLPERTCFEHFSAHINPGDRILIIGNNGTGKSTLLKMLQGLVDSSEGSISKLGSMVFGYVPQTITDYAHLSGGQRFNKALSAALSKQPEILCLDEPTNHLDMKNKQSLIRMLKGFKNTLIIVSHDPEVMALDYSQIWHIEHGVIDALRGDYAEFLHEHDRQATERAAKREQLHKEKRMMRKAEHRERERSASRKSANRYETDKNLLGSMKERASRSTGKAGRRLSDIEQKIKTGLCDTFVHKKIEPNFNLNAHRFSSAKSIVSIVDGSCGYANPVVHSINMQVGSTEHIGIVGDNGTGKSTFLKALLHDHAVITDGQWSVPPRKDIGYLDQHYSTLNPDNTVLAVIQNAAVSMNDTEIQKVLNDFLFNKPHERAKKVRDLSGGEKARLSLAQIAVSSCYLLLLDEITNNVDLDTRQHIIEVLREYPGAMIIVSHDQHFLEQLRVKTVYKVVNCTLRLVS